MRLGVLFGLLIWLALVVKVDLQIALVHSSAILSLAVILMMRLSLAQVYERIHLLLYIYDMQPALNGICSYTALMRPPLHLKVCYRYAMLKANGGLYVIMDFGVTMLR
jgi:hypothetical protein